MPKVRILSLDPGTQNTGYILLEGDLLSKEIAVEAFGVLKTKVTDGDIRKRIDTLGNGVRKLISTFEPDYLVFEDFVEQGKMVGKTYKEMAFLIEHYRLIGRETGIPTEIYSNAYWKKHTLGVSGTNKAQVEHYVSRKIPETKRLLNKAPSHVWDATAIGYCLWLSIV